MEWTVLAAITVAVVVAMLAELLRGNGALRFLDREPAPDGASVPSVSVVIAARDEERGIEAALRSVLAQDHPRMEVTVVDDRSTDGTPAVLARLAAAEPRLRVVRIDALPPGWLGKNHALHRGAAGARGALILFTDADIVMRPDAVRRAAGHLAREGLDHLTLAPRVAMPGLFLQAFGVFFGIMFTLFARPWRASDPEDPAHVGIGAFNLLRAEAYRAIGGHAPIRMRPDDDVKLGKLVKRHRLRQDFAMGTGLLRVEWYHTVRGAVHGLRKNAFAGLDYRLSLVLLATLVQLLFLVWPFAALLVTDGAAFALYLTAVLLLLAMYAGGAHHQGAPLWGALLFPLLGILFLVIVWNSTLYTLRHRGIEWRGTHYPLDELRANRV